MLPPSSPEPSPEPNEITSSLVDDTESALLTNEDEDILPRKTLAIDTIAEVEVDTEATKVKGEEATREGLLEAPGEIHEVSTHTSDVVMSTVEDYATEPDVIVAISEQTMFQETYTDKVASDVEVSSAKTNQSADIATIKEPRKLDTVVTEQFSQQAATAAVVLESQPESDLLNSCKEERQKLSNDNNLHDKERKQSENVRRAWNAERERLSDVRQQFMTEDHNKLKDEELRQEKLFLWIMHRNELTDRRVEFFNQEDAKLQSELGKEKTNEHLQVVDEPTSLEAVDGAVIEKKVSEPVVETTKKITQEQHSLQQHPQPENSSNFATPSLTNVTEKEKENKEKIQNFESSTVPEDATIKSFEQTFEENTPSVAEQQEVVDVMETQPEKHVKVETHVSEEFVELRPAVGPLEEMLSNEKLTQVNQSDPELDLQQNHDEVVLDLDRATAEKQDEPQIDSLDISEVQEDGKKKSPREIPRDIREKVIYEAFENINNALNSARQQIIEVELHEEITPVNNTAYVSKDEMQELSVTGPSLQTNVVSKLSKPIVQTCKSVAVENTTPSVNKNETGLKSTQEDHKATEKILEQEALEEESHLESENPFLEENKQSKHTVPAEGKDELSRDGSDELHKQPTAPADAMLHGEDHGRTRRYTVPVAHSTPVNESRSRSFTARKRKDSLTEDSVRGDVGRGEDVRAIAEMLALKYSIHDVNNIKDESTDEVDAICEDKPSEKLDPALLAFKSDIVQNVQTENATEVSHTPDEEHVEMLPKNQSAAPKMEEDVNSTNETEQESLPNKGVHSSPSIFDKTQEEKHGLNNIDSGIVDESLEQTIIADIANQSVESQLELFEAMAASTENIENAKGCEENVAVNDETMAQSESEELKVENDEVSDSGTQEEDIKTHVSETNTPGPIEEMFIVNKEASDQLRMGSLKSLKLEIAEDSQMTTDGGPLSELEAHSLNISTLKSMGIVDSESDIPKDTSYSESQLTSDDEQLQQQRLPVDDMTPSQVDRLLMIPKKTSDTSVGSYTEYSLPESEEEGVIAYQRVPQGLFFCGVLTFAID